MNLDKNYIGKKGITVEERFFSHVTKTKNGCWEWGLSKSKRYGRFKFLGRSFLAHRFSYFLHTGYMPSNKEYVCHKCDNVYCVNPNHLFLGAQQDNMDDMVRKGRSPDVKGEKNPRAKISESDVLKIKKMKNTTSRKELAKMFNTSKSTINNILRGYTWSHVDE